MRAKNTKSCLLILLLALSGCSYISGGQQAPVSNIQSMGSSTYKVKEGDTIEGVSDGFNVSIGNLALWNHLSPPYDLNIGQKLWIVAPPKESRAPVLQTMEPGIVIVTPQETKPVPKPVINKPAPSPVLVNPAPINMPINTPVVNNIPDANIPKISQTGWIWPMQGHVTPDVEGGIDIESKAHTNVVAAKSGKVIYSGPDVSGDGKMVILDQGDGFLSAYGNLESIRVKEGASVSRADSLGRVKDVLHFEIRESGNSMDVSKYLPAL